MTRVRRCSWSFGERCHEPAERVIQTTYLGQPTDRDVLMCVEHSGRAHELVRPGWEIVNIEPLPAPEEVRA